MFLLPIPAYISTVSQLPEASLAKLEPTLQTAVAELKHLGYTLRYAGTVFHRARAVELKHPRSPHIVVILLEKDQVKLHLNVTLSEALYSQREALQLQLTSAFPGLRQRYTTSGNNEPLANLSFVSATATPPKGWYAEILTVLNDAADQLVGKSRSRLDKLALAETFKAGIELGLRDLAGAGFTVTRLSRRENTSPQSQLFVQLTALDFKGHESTVVFSYHDGVTRYTTNTERHIAQKRETVEQALGSELRRSLPDTEIVFLTPSDKPGTCTIQLSYSLALAERIGVVQQLQSFGVFHFLCTKKALSPE